MSLPTPQRARSRRSEANYGSAARAASAAPSLAPSLWRVPREARSQPIRKGPGRKDGAERKEVGVWTWLGLAGRGGG